MKDGCFSFYKMICFHNKIVLIVLVTLNARDSTNVVGGRIAITADL